MAAGLIQLAELSKALGVDCPKLTEGQAETVVRRYLIWLLTFGPGGGSKGNLVVLELFRQWEQGRMPPIADWKKAHTRIYYDRSEAERVHGYALASLTVEALIEHTDLGDLVHAADPVFTEPLSPTSLRYQKEQLLALVDPFMPHTPALAVPVEF